VKRSELECYRHKSKTDYYIRHGRRRWEDLFASVRHFLEANDLAGEKVLDVGCADGGTYEIMKARYGRVEYTGLDVSRAEVRHAREVYPDAKFLVGDFLENRFKARSFDTVCAFQVLNHQPRYRKFIAEMFRVARKRVIFSARVQYDFPTVVDLDSSFIYYHGSGKRQYFIPFNFYELFNYLHVERFAARRIAAFGYHTPEKTSAFVCMPRSKVVSAAFCIEKYPPEEKVERWGGRGEFAERSWCEHDLRLPDLPAQDL
jgi:SAM-dependent methyltransferase